MDTHQMQMQVRYDQVADRILWEVRSFQNELHAVWLTRHMVKKLWPPFQQLVSRADLRDLLPSLGASPAAVVTPEARSMLAEQSRERPLPSARFDVPFQKADVQRPADAAPMLPASVDLGPGPDNTGVMIHLREPQGRGLKLQLTAEMANALARLVERALKDADWDLGPARADPVTPSPAAPRHLN